MPLQLHPSTLTSILGFIHCFLLMLPVVSASCREHVKNYCGNIGCQQGLMTKKLDMYESCDKLRSGNTDECDEHCQRAITELLNAYNGSEGLFTCNCTDTQVFYNQADCELDRRRLYSCPPLVAFLQTEVDSCIVASQDCEGDITCKARLDAYLLSCNPEQLNPLVTPCSRECIGDLEALYAEPHASNVWECSCEDTPEEWCRTSPRKYQQLCMRHIANMSTPKVPYKPLTIKPTYSPTKSAYQNRQSPENNSKGPSAGNLASTINTQAICLISLVTSILGMFSYL